MFGTLDPSHEMVVQCLWQLAYYITRFWVWHEIVHETMSKDAQKYSSPIDPNLHWPYFQGASNFAVQQATGATDERDEFNVLLSC